MSIIIRLLGRLMSGLAPRDRAPLDPEAMSLHDWADLPVHHPQSECAPC